MKPASVALTGIGFPEAVASRLAVTWAADIRSA